MSAVKIPLAGSAILPRDMNAREHASFMNNQSARNIRTDDAAGYNVGQGVWFGRDTDGVVKLFIGDAAGNKILWDGSTLTVVGDLTLENVSQLSDISANMGTLTAGVIALSSGGLIRSGQTAYDTGTGFFLGNVSGTPKLSIGNSSGNKVTWDGSSLSVVGTLTGSSVSNLGSLSANLGTITAASVTLGTNGYVKQGQSAYDTGTGFWLGDVSGTPKFSIGNASGNKLTWDGSALSVSGVIDLANTAQTFTPEWSVAGIGPFSSDPTGDLSYVNLGRLVIIYTTSAITGTSDDNYMSILNLPTGAKPPVGATGTCMVVDNGTTVFGSWSRSGFSTLDFSIAAVSGSKVGFSSTGFTSSGTKGLPAGWALIYAK